MSLFAFVFEQLLVVLMLAAFDEAVEFEPEGFKIIKPEPDDPELTNDAIGGPGKVYFALVSKI